MIEIPESQTIARQIRETLAGRVVTDVFNATHPHKFAWYSGDPLEYPKLLSGRKIVGAVGRGAFIDVLLEDDLHLAVSDGVNLRLYGAQDPIPAKYQLLMTLDDGRFLSLTVAMYGGIHAFRDDLDNPYYQCARTKCSPLEERFDAACFARLRASVKAEPFGKGLSGYRTADSGSRKRRFAGYSFPGGDSSQAQARDAGGCRCGASFHDAEKPAAGDDRPWRPEYRKGSLRQTGRICRAAFTQYLRRALPRCGGPIVKEAYLGGAVYYCPHCQPIV